MIEVSNVVKEFDGFRALDGTTLHVGKGDIYGLVGPNGAGKSTIIRHITGVYKQDAGTVLIDGMPVFENPAVKEKFAYIPDELFYFMQADTMEMKRFYQGIYPKFDAARFDKLLKNFELESRRKVQTFSKGMKKQLAVLLGICAGTDYLFCDETFDGLDPVMRQTVKSLFANDIEERNLTPVIASHNLRELEDICDHVGLLHKGGMLLSKDLDDMKLNIHKIQCVLPAGVGSSDLQGIDIIKTEQRGSLLTLTVRGKREEIQTILQAYHPVFFEMIPLSLEEIFISETEVAGYDIKRLVF